MDIFGMGTRHGLSAFEQVAVLGVVITAFLSLLYAWLLRGNVLNKDKGSQKMQDVWETIRIGAESYLQATAPAEFLPGNPVADGSPVPECVCWFRLARRLLRSSLRTLRSLWRLGALLLSLWGQVSR